MPYALCACRTSMRNSGPASASTSAANAVPPFYCATQHGVQPQELPHVRVGLARGLLHVALHWSKPHVTLALAHTLPPAKQVRPHMPNWLHVMTKLAQALELLQLRLQP